MGAWSDTFAVPARQADWRVRPCPRIRGGCAFLHKPISSVGSSLAQSASVRSTMPKDGMQTYALAALPLLLGAHQVIEAFVWLGLQGHEPQELERIALWAYL